MAAPTRKKNTRKRRSTSPRPRLDHIHHVAIPVPDIPKAVEWYTSRFHCRVDYVDKTWALLAFANTKLALILPHEHPPHFALSRPDANKFGELVTHRDGLHSVYISDAFGNSVEILETPRDED